MATDNKDVKEEIKQNLDQASKVGDSTLKTLSFLPKSGSSNNAQGTIKERSHFTIRMVDLMDGLKAPPYATLVTAYDLMEKIKEKNKSTLNDEVEKAMREACTRLEQEIQVRTDLHDKAKDLRIKNLRAFTSALLHKINKPPIDEITIVVESNQKTAAVKSS